MYIRYAILMIFTAAVVALPGWLAAQDEAKYVGVDEVAAECRLTVFHEELSNRLKLLSEDTEVVVAPGLDIASLDAETVRLGARVRFEKGEVQIPESFATAIKDLVERKRLERLRKSGKISEGGRKLRRVVLDPGHGGKFPGAVAHGMEEKEINLSIAFKVRDILVDEGIEVLMTRTKDVELSDDLSTDLDMRCDFTNSKKADIFVSIHTDSYDDPSATGFTVYTARLEEDLERRAAKGTRESPLTGDELGGKLKPDAEMNKILWKTLLREYHYQSRELAKKICKKLDANVNDINRGVKEEGFRVIKWTRCPAVLVEVGFMSNWKTAQKLKTDSYRNKLARGIAQGILEFKKEYDRTDGFTRSSDRQRPRGRRGAGGPNAPPPGGEAGTGHAPGRKQH